MSNKNISCKTSFLMTMIFSTVITISMIMAPTLYNNPFVIWNTSIQFPINLTYAQLNGDNNSSESSSTTEEEEPQQEEQIPTTEEQTTPSTPEISTSPLNNESSTITNQIDDDNTTTTTDGPSEGPDRDCLFNPSLPKCAAIDGECPDGFNQNEDEQCVPEGGCPEGYHTVDDDESGRCILNSDGCPSGMIFRPDGKTCGYKDELCQDDPQLEGCVETPQECNNNIDDDGDGLIDSEDPDCMQQPPNCDPSYLDRCIPSPPPVLECEDVSFRNFQVNSSSDPHGFDKDEDGIGCETNSDSEPDNDSDNNEGQTTTNIITVPQDTCSDAFGTINLGPGQIDSNAVRIVGFFDECELATASILSNYPPNENLKLVVANFDEQISDAAEVIQSPVSESNLNSNQVLNTVTITSTQQGYDLETGEFKTVNNVNGIVLWNSGDEPIEFDQGNTIDVSLDFYN